MEKENKVPVGLYLRISTAEQKDNFSLETQERDLLRYVEFMSYRGWYTKPEWIFTEQASAGNMDREELQELLRLAKSQKIEVFLIWSVDRLSRKLEDLIHIFATLSKLNISLCSYKENMDFTNPFGKAALYISGMFAELERDNIKIRTEEGKKTSARAGNYIGGWVPYAYEKVANPSGRGSKLKLVPEETEWVKQIFHWYIYDKKGFAEIAHELNRLGVSKGKSVRPEDRYTTWKPARIKDILTNDIYRGEYIANRYKTVSVKPRRKVERDRSEWIITPVDAAINPTIFYEAQERILNGQRGLPGGGKETYMLSRKLIDIKTGKGFIGYKTSNGTRNYRRKRYRNKRGVIQKSISIAARSLEPFAWSWVKKALSNPDSFIEAYKKSKHTVSAQMLESELDVYKKALDEAEQRIERVKQDFYHGGIDEAERDKFLAEYEEERLQADENLRLTKDRLSSLQSYKKACKDLKRFAKSMPSLDKLTYKQKASLVKLAVSRVEIHETSSRRVARFFLSFEPSLVASIFSRVRTGYRLKLGRKSSSKPSKSRGGGRTWIRTMDLLGVNQTL